MYLETMNPATGKVIQRYPLFSDTQLLDSLEAAHAAYLHWCDLDFQQRAEKMRALADILKQKQEEYARLITCEMGKPIVQSRAEIEKCMWICKHYAEHAETYLRPQAVKTELSKAVITYEPRGILFSITPWNFPFWQVFRVAAANLMAGNVVILSHAPIATGTGLAIEEAFWQAGFPPSVFTTLIISHEQAEQVIAHPYVRGVSLTGSGRAGQVVASLAGRYLKKSVLELGGNDPYVILADADVAQAAAACVQGRMLACGQVCVSPKRLIVVDEIYDAFETCVLKEIQAYSPSDPLREDCLIGPMARYDLRERLAEQVKESIARGAQCLYGGNIIEGEGFYYQPTVLSHVQTGMPAYEEELFGPVISLIRARDEQEAIKLANDSCYGLGGGVFTADPAHGEAICRQLQVGFCAVNTLVRSDPRLPFGGGKQSGYGYECGEEGIRAFTHIKVVTVA